MAVYDDIMADRSFQNSNLVIKNGTYLLVRMLLVLFLAFFTTRITLLVLGDEKFGIYTVVGGVIAIFAVVSMPIRDSIQRFFNVETAKKHKEAYIVFNTSVNIVFLMISVMVFLYETIGLYVVNNIIKYPQKEHIIVNVIFQIMVISNIFGFLSLPYLSLLFSKENMSTPAICEILASIFKLVLLLVIPYIPVNSLIPYTCIFLLTYISQYIFYRFYCEKNYTECSFKGFIDKKLQMKMLSFSGWSFIEAVAGITITYISNILINIFGGILYNAAYGISKQLQDAVVGFSLNVLKATDPQIMSNTATNNNAYRDQLVLTTMKISFLGVSFVSILFHFDGLLLLNIWLGKVPNYVFEFSRVALLTVVVTSICLPIRSLIMATGKIKWNFIAYGVDSAVIIVLMYIMLKLGFPVITVMYLILTSGIIMFVVGVVIVIRVSTIGVRDIIKNIGRALFVLCIVFLIYFFTVKYILFEGAFVRFCISAAMSFCSLMIFTFYVALNKAEREKVKNVCNRIMGR